MPMSTDLIHIIDDYFLRPIGLSEYLPYYFENESKVYSDSLTINVWESMSKIEQEKQQELYKAIKDRYSFQAFIMKGEMIIGWHSGWQVDEEKYYMCDTALFKEYQGQGIYTALLPILIDLYRAQGFQKIYSRHLASNNAVIVPKLRAGFVITGFEIEVMFGLMVVLTYFCSDKRFNAYKFRTGALRPNEDLKKFL